MAENVTAYPLTWPSGRPRTATPKPALFRNGGNRMSLSAARKRLNEQMAAMTRVGQTWRVTDVILSMNIRFTASGGRDQNVSRRDPDDAGAALYFNLDRRPHVLACDRWNTVADNVAAIAAHIEALRGQERWGVADLRQAFAGHAALPAPAGSRPWSDVLGLSDGASSAEISVAYRAKAKAAAGDEQKLLALNLARDAAQMERRP